MTEQNIALAPDPELDPERYELYAGPAYQFRFARRGFLRALGSGLLVTCAARAQDRPAGNRPRGPEAAPRDSRDVGAIIHIADRGAVTLFVGKVEVGQNIRTTLAQIVADELAVPLESIELVMADTERTPWDAGTFGSRTSPVTVPQVRRVAAAARKLMAEKPQRDPVTGTSAPKANARDFVTGRHKFTSDIKRPGMWYGRVVRPAMFGAKPVLVDLKNVEALGAKSVHDGNFVGVAAPSAPAALTALAAAKVEWSPNSQMSPQISNAELAAHLKSSASPGRPERRGSVADGLAQADVRLRSSYTVAYIAHAPLEPRAAVAEWEGDKLIVWTGTQRPFGVRTELAQAFRIPETQVRVIVPDTGSAYGGKHSGESAIEAARLARAAGHPVKLVWTREEEFTWAYFRPAGVIEVSSGARADGTLTAWEFHNYNSGGSSIRPLYDVPNVHTEFHGSSSPLRQGSYRALAATANHFARESHIDELAHKLKIDPVEFRLRNLKDARLRAVLEAAAERFGWVKSKTAGIACGFEKGSYVAACAEIATDAAGAIRVTRVVEAFECGTVLNPGHLRSQIEGAIVQGLGGALFEAIHFAGGKILNPRFSRYRVPRFSDLPQVETVLVDRKDLPSAGAGETPIVAIAPAAANAYFRVTGKRLYGLPLMASPPVARS